MPSAQPTVFTPPTENETSPPKKRGRPAGAAGDPTALTKRELQIALLLASGRTNREVAESLDISIKTVDTHRGHVLNKLAVRNNTELALFWVYSGRTTLANDRVDHACTAHPVVNEPAPAAADLATPG